MVTYVEPPTGRLSAVEVEVLRGDEKNYQVAGNESSEDTQVSPSVAELVSKRSIELVADLVGAVIADVGGVVEEVSGRTAGEEVAHVRSTFLALWGAELVVLARCTLDFEVMKFSNNHAADEARERVQLIEPYTPEFGD